MTEEYVPVSLKTMLITDREIERKVGWGEGRKNGREGRREGEREEREVKGYTFQNWT